MSQLSKELIRQMVEGEKFSSTKEIMDAIKKNVCRCSSMD